MSNNMHQLHINIPIDLYEQIKKITPDRGGITSLVRNLLRHYTIDHKKFANTPGENPFDTAVRGTVKSEIMKHGTHVEEDEYRGG